MFKRNKFTRGKTCIKPPKRWVKKQSTGTGEQCSQVSKIGNLGNFAGCQISQHAKFAGCQILQPPKFQQFAHPFFNEFALNFL